MGRESITSAHNKALQKGFLDLMGESKSGFQSVEMNNILDSLVYIGALYTKNLKDGLVSKDVDSSGRLSDSIVASEVELLGKKYEVSISMNKYGKFLSQGVNGWAKDRGSAFSFKTKGVKADSPMVKEIKDWLLRESSISTLTKKVQVSEREKRRASITDASTRAAMTTAYMIKRMGIKPTKFIADATNDIKAVIKKEFAAAIKIDIIENLTK